MFIKFSRTFNPLQNGNKLGEFLMQWEEPRLQLFSKLVQCDAENGRGPETDELIGREEQTEAGDHHVC